MANGMKMYSIDTNGVILPVVNDAIASGNVQAVNEL